MKNEEKELLRKAILMYMSQGELKTHIQGEFQSPQEHSIPKLFIIKGTDEDNVGSWVSHIDKESEFENSLIEDVYLILLPLSDFSSIDEITEEMRDIEIEHLKNKIEFLPTADHLVRDLNFEAVRKMLKHKIDIFNLIPNKLAESVHNLEGECYG